MRIYYIMKKTSSPNVGCAVRTEKNMQAVDSWCAWRTLQTIVSSERIGGGEIKNGNRQAVAVEESLHNEKNNNPNLV